MEGKESCEDCAFAQRGLVNMAGTGARVSEGKNPGRWFSQQLPKTEELRHMELELSPALCCGPLCHTQRHQ